MKTCPKCGKEKPYSDFWGNKARDDGLTVYCKDCDYSARRHSIRKWRITHRDRLLISQRKSSKKRRKIKRLFLIDYYSNGERKCACCGDTHLEFLAIDHVDGEGNKHRKKFNITGSMGLYNWLRDRGFPKEGFQVLCFNCNQAKAAYGECPHVKERNANN